MEGVGNGREVRGREGGGGVGTVEREGGTMSRCSRD